jgi:GDP/UDP-N,N'-diacetylbacillosamine 2-epimerase (hydrolysing)
MRKISITSFVEEARRRVGVASSSLGGGMNQSAPLCVWRILIVSTSRADFWPLESVVKQLAATEDFLPVVALCGAHQSSWANTDFCSLGRVPMVLVHQDANLANENESTESLMSFASRCGVGIARLLDEDRPDAVIVLGDRFELLSVATACSLAGVPLVHLHGGEVTEGAIDDDVRHAVTKLSQLHLCATERSRIRILQLGEQSENVVVVGAPGNDRLSVDVSTQESAALHAVLGFDPDEEWALVAYHPPTRSLDQLESELEALVVGASASSLQHFVVTSPGVEVGSERIRERFNEWAQNDPRVRLHSSLGTVFPSALRLATCLIGNSSSGLIEAPAIGTPSLNIGDRQRGREEAPSVRTIPSAAGAVASAIHDARQVRRIDRFVAGSDVPYGGPGASRRILEALRVFLAVDTTNHKRFVDVAVIDPT